MMESIFQEAIDNPLVQAWIKGHRLGLAATILLDGIPSVQAYRRAARRFIDECLSVINRPSREAWLAAYPLFTLEQLLTLAEEEAPFRAPSQVVKGKASLLKNTLAKLTSQVEGQRVCTVRAVEQIEQLVFHSNWGAVQLRRLVISNMSRFYTFKRKEWEHLEEPLAPYLRTLRSPWSLEHNTPARVEAAMALAPVFHRRVWVTRRIISSLCDRLFAWPLLVLGGAEEAISVPIGVDIAVATGRAKPGVSILTQHGTRIIDASAWIPSFPRIINSVEEMFKHAQGGRAAAWQGRLNVTLDFRFAEAIAQDLAKLYILDQSMETYPAGVILSRLFGQPMTPQTVATGAIGEGVLLSANLVWPEGVPYKVSYVFSASIFDRIIIPGTTQGEQQSDGTSWDKCMDEMRHRQTASVLPVKKVRTALRILGGPLAAPQQYVRCPELALPNPTLYHGHPRLESLCEMLKRHESGFVDLSAQNATSDVSAHDVLFYLQQVKRRCSVLSWLFVKLNEDEHDDVLWELIGEAIGASEAEISSLLCAPTPAELACHFAQMLTWGQVRANASMRRDVPTVIVIVGGSERMALYAKTPDKSAYPHALKPVLEHVDQLGLMVNRKGDSDLGKARIILTPASKLKAANIIEPSETDAAPAWLDRLRVFRGAFDQGCAAALLGDVFPEARIHSVLQEAVSNGWLLKLSDGDYLVSLGRGVPIRDQLSALHYQAGLAFAPQMALNLQRVGLPASEASRVANVLEASYHFLMARRNRHLRYGEHKDRTDLVFLHRFFRRRSYGSTIDKVLIKHSGLGRTLLKWIIEDIDDFKASGYPVHPYHFAAAGMCGADAVKTAEDKSERLGDILHVLDEGIDACERPELVSEKDFLFARVVSIYDQFVTQLYEEKLGSFLPKEVGKRLEELNRSVRDLMLHDASFSLVGAPVGGWYARRGEDEPDDGKAAILYARSVMGHPTYYNAWPRLFGSIERARGRTSIDVDSLMRIALSTLRDNPDILTKLQDEQTNYRNEEIFAAANKLSEALCRAFRMDNYRQDRVEKGQKYLEKLSTEKVDKLLRGVPLCSGSVGAVAQVI